MLTEEQARAVQRRTSLVTRARALMAEGKTQGEAAKAVGVSTPTLCRWLQRTDPAQATHKCGRQPGYQPNEAELELVRQLYVRLNTREVKGRNTGSSKITAFRLVASSDDPRVSEDFRTVVLRRTSKSLPPTWVRLLDTPSTVLATSRDRDAIAGNISTPRGFTFIARDGSEQILRAGSIFESDDGTLNFPIVIPWPYGGDPCSDKFGCKVGRFQFLPIIDRRSLFCPLFHVIVRAKSSYRAEDVVALFGDCFFEVGMPSGGMVLERGSWDSHMVRDTLKMLDLPVLHAWTPQQKPAVEKFFDRVWTPLSILPGDVGRYRGENSDNTEVLLQCEAGRRDPRKHFLSLDEATAAIGQAVTWCNTEPVQSKKFGRFVPQQIWEQQTTDCPLQRPESGLQIFFARERREWTVRKNLVGGRVETPQLRFPIWFQCEALWEFQGCKVKVFFDPFTDPCLGTLVLQHDWRSYKKGHIIAHQLPALDMVPQAIFATDWEKPEELQKTLAMRKAMAKAVRTELWTWRGARRTEARDGTGNTTRVERTAEPTPRLRAQPVTQPQRHDEPLEEETITRSCEPLPEVESEIIEISDRSEERPVDHETL